MSETVKKCFRQTESSASSWRVLESRNKSNGIKMCCLLKYFWAKNDDNFSKRHRDDVTKRHKDNVVTKLKLSQSFLTCVTHACCVKTLAFLAVAVVIFCLFGNPSNESSTPVTAVTHGSRLDIVRFIFADDVPSRAMRSGINTAKTFLPNAHNARSPLGLFGPLFKLPGNYFFGKSCPKLSRIF